MTDTAPPTTARRPLKPSGTVHWIGAGLSTGSGLAALCERADRVRLWHRTADRAAGSLARLGLADRAEPRAYTLDALAAELRPGDVVVSMLPATEHGALLGLCIERRAHFANSSYVSDDIVQRAPAAAEAALVVLVESGLDPGLDHLFAHSLIARARAAVGDAPATAEFTSYCGGLPAVPNDFRYRFSWAPRGVLNALRTPARYIDEGVPVTASRPWEATRPFTVDAEPFEVYPNRDSVPYIAQYGVPPSWTLTTFVRGTLRLDGWRRAWAPVFDELRHNDEARLTALAGDLATRYPTTPDDRDRVVLIVDLKVRTEHDSWSGRYVLDMVGDRNESAMARCVSLPLANGVTEILEGALPPGLHRAAETPARADRWLENLAQQGISYTLQEPTSDS
ncbi:saccharopine dehydrogenase family protein [Spirillospora sp. NPDC050679]